MEDQFVLCRMASFGEDKFERLNIFFFEALEFAHKHVPGMHETKEMSVAFDLHGAGRPICCAFESSWVADLNVKGALLFGQALRVHEIEEKVPGFFRTEEVDVRAQKALINKKLNGRRTKDREVELWFWGQ